MYVRELAINPTNDFTSAEQRLRDEGRIASVPLLRREVEAARVRETWPASAGNCLCRSSGPFKQSGRKLSEP